ncbi:MAG: TIGR03943 family protein [Patescibacteria group bacterium]
MHTKWKASLLTAASTYVLYLWLSGQLNLYIHPRYTVFAGIAAGACLGLSILSSAGSPAQKNKRIALPELSLIVLLLSGILLPASTLSESTFSQRLIDGQPQTTGSTTTAPVLIGSTKGLDIRDWTNLLSRHSDPGFFTNKPAHISGFVYDAGLGSDTFLLARFVVTCCAVDARPIGIPVHLPDWVQQYSLGDWLEVEGVFKPDQAADREPLSLHTTEVNRIDVPEDPYVQ